MKRTKKRSLRKIQLEPETVAMLKRAKIDPTTKKGQRQLEAMLRIVLTAEFLGVSKIVPISVQAMVANRKK